ncbi:right-handed parallel beta-helix repeat-containing protein [Candidatus Micrarchaeota archaeon]|nr:right-handed parallel beta-helix repeat-containing protein [Candidatus Micrarchaeota archaeon]
MNGRIFILAFLLAISIGFSVDVSTCSNITAPGTYVLTADLVGFPNNASEAGFSFSGYDWACIKIASQDVVFDCNGHSIWGNDTSVQNISIGIFVNESAGSNVTIKNCNIYDYNYGFFSEFTNEIALQNVTSFSNAGTGIFISSSNYSIVDSCLSYGNTGSSFVMAGCDNCILSNNTAQNGVPGSSGYYVTGCFNVLVINNTAINAGHDGFYIQSLSNATVRDNYASGHTNYEFRLGSTLPPL